MNPIDVDLDVSKMLEGLPESHVCLYIRASDEDMKDFCYANGDMEYLAVAIASIMGQSDTFCEIIQAANAYYLDEL